MKTVELDLRDAVSVQTGRFTLLRWLQVGPLLWAHGVEVKGLTLTDREPYAIVQSQMWTAYCWLLPPDFGGRRSVREGVTYRHHLPHEIYALLPGVIDAVRREENAKGYWTREGAVEALVAACRVYAASSPKVTPRGGAFPLPYEERWL